MPKKAGKAEQSNKDDDNTLYLVISYMALVSVSYDFDMIVGSVPKNVYVFLLLLPTLAKLV